MVLQQIALVNIGSRDRRLRLTLGALTVLIGIVIAYLLGVNGTSVWWRALVFIPFAVGFSLIMESRKGVCPMLANKGQRNLEGLLARSGDVIEDQALADGIRRVGRILVVQSTVGAIVLTAIFMLIPA